MTLITVPDNRPLLSLPVWIPGSLRTAGYDRSLWYALWEAIALSYLPVTNDIIDFANNDPATWGGSDEAELDFLSFWMPDFTALRQTLDGYESDADRLERLLTLRTLLNAPFPESARISGWALTAALGLAVRSTVAVGSLPVGAFIPSMEGRPYTNLTLDNSNPGTLTRRDSLGDDSLMVASVPLWSRTPVNGAPPTRLSPWGRASSMPILDSGSVAIGDGTKADVVKDLYGRSTLTYSFPSSRYRKVIRPGTLDPSTPVEVLTSSDPIVVQTMTDGMRNGVDDLRVPGGRLPSPRWRQAAPPAFTASWATGPRRDSEVIAPPFDLDTDLSQPTPSAVPLYGTGVVPSGLAVDHPLATDYA